MKRPSKNEIKAAIDKLKDKPPFSSGGAGPRVGHLSGAKCAERKTKQGV